jgi:hypothetical protein
MGRTGGAVELRSRIDRTDFERLIKRLRELLVQHAV